MLVRQAARGELNDAAYLDILTYILQANSFPAGTGELTVDALDRIQIVGRNGPKPLPSLATVRAVGCLTRGSDESWALTLASEPVRIRTLDRTTPEELEASEAMPLGTQTFGLENLAYFRAGFSPDSSEGHKMQAKGLLIRRPDRISVTSLEMVALSCAP